MVRVRKSLDFFNRLFIVPKPNQKWRPILDLSALNKFLAVKTFKMETPETIHISSARGMGDIIGLQRHLFPYPNTQTVTQIPEIPLPGSDLSVLGPSVQPLNSSYGVHFCGQGSKTDGPGSRYNNPPVRRRLVGSSPDQGVLPPGQSIPPRPLSGIRFGGQSSKV